VNQPLTITEVTSVADAEAVSSFFNSVWADGDEVVPFDLILAAIHVGAYCVLAKRDNVVVGASFGFLGTHNGESILHSHVTASTQPGVGYAIKMHQHGWATSRGISAITWTFDPLVRRNCYFNFVKLGATAIEYLPNFYGAMTDSINKGDVSDRLFAYWPLTSTPIVRAFEAQSIQIALPEDIETLRKTQPESAAEWRVSIRELIRPKLDAGWKITGMSDDRTSLILTPPKEQE
jgi:predicted GNAT superfamily acetyltransferase